MKHLPIPAALLLATLPICAAEFHVSDLTGNDANAGAVNKPFKTISAAAEKAMPGDTITVHTGVYRERVNPPRSGTSDTNRITYQAAKGEKVIITGSDEAKGWVKVDGDTWKLTLPNKHFGNFNPYSDTIFGDWFTPNGRIHHTGCVYLDGNWMIEATSLDQVLKPAGQTPLWFATVDGVEGTYLLNLAKVTTAAGASVAGAEPSYRYGGKPAPGCSGYIQNGHWMRFDNVDFGKNSDSVTLNVSAQPGSGGIVELRLDHPEGEFLGTCEVTSTGSWTTWLDVKAKIKPTSGKRSLCLVFKGPKVDAGSTTIHAQFPKGIDPNKARVEINTRQTVFYPSRNHIDYITVRGFTLLNAASQWAPPSSEQTAIVGTNWSKGWIIENNEIAYSKCSGVSLGKYGDGTDNTNDAGTADPYTACVRRALANGWSKEKVGAHIVRNNHIHHCEQTGIVGSMGCAFSIVEGNEIHDIWVHRLFSGFEQAGIKFHGFVDGVVRDNHVYNNGCFGLWLDWMGQGGQVTGNLFHQNGQSDIFCEMQHGPMLIANNVTLSPIAYWFNAKSLAVAHNLIGGAFCSYPYDDRKTPYHPPHSTEIAGLFDAPSGDHRLYNNISVGAHNPNWGGTLDSAKMPCVAEGNVFVQGAAPTKFDVTPLVKNNWNAKLAIVCKDGAWYLSLAEDKDWKDAAKTKLVTTAMLGKAKVPQLPYENADGSPFKIDTDYFGKKRATANPFPGPFEMPVNDEVKVWPK